MGNTTMTDISLITVCNAKFGISQFKDNHSQEGEWLDSSAWNLNMKRMVAGFATSPTMN
jgi:hypothetical protein